jgi:hypothetical protein
VLPPERRIVGGSLRAFAFVTPKLPVEKPASAEK